ncbi:MAG: rhomboid family intramembrane serine protease [Paludibacter sp.]|nr:rhomboid family intramembrane serine protease [Paludibacter sp.]
MQFLIIIIFLLVFAFFGNSLGYDSVFPLYKHLTFNFQHANLMHLLINSVAFLSVFRLLRPYLRPCLFVFGSLFITVAASFLPFCYYDRPVVGASGMIYAMLGMWLALIATKKIRYKNYKFLYLFALSLVICSAVGFYRANSAVTLHFCCLLCGFILCRLSLY